MTIPQAQRRLSQKVSSQRQKAAQEAFQRRFAAFVRGCDYQLNVMRTWPFSGVEYEGP